MGEPTIGSETQGTLVGQDYSLVLAECIACKERLRQLIEENERLEHQLGFYERHTNAVGLMAEAYVVGLVKGTADGSGRCDAIARNGSRLEIKFSRPRLKKSKNKARKEIYRWGWSNVTGLDDCKKYDRLILIGEADTKFKSGYLAPDSRYILFDIPRFDVLELSVSNGQRKRQIMLNADMNAAKSTSRTLFERYQITEAELVERYGRNGSGSATVTRL